MQASSAFGMLQVGRQEPVMVLRVDKEKGYIDLSKRRVSAEDIAACEDRFGKSKMVHSIMRHVAETTGQDVEELYKHVAWPLYKAYGHAFDAFKVSAPCARLLLKHSIACQVMHACVGHPPEG